MKKSPAALAGLFFSSPRGAADFPVMPGQRPGTHDLGVERAAEGKSWMPAKAGMTAKGRRRI